MAKQVEMDSKCLQRAGFLEVMRQGPRTTFYRTRHLPRVDIYTKYDRFYPAPIISQNLKPPEICSIKIND